MRIWKNCIIYLFLSVPKMTSSQIIIFVPERPKSPLPPSPSQHLSDLGGPPKRMTSPHSIELPSFLFPFKTLLIFTRCRQCLLSDMTIATPYCLPRLNIFQILLCLFPCYFLSPSTWSILSSSSWGLAPPTLGPLLQLCLCFVIPHLLFTSPLRVHVFRKPSLTHVDNLAVSLAPIQM